MQFFFIAYGSDCELETRDMTSAGLGYLKEERLQRLRREIRGVGAMSKAMIKSLERKPLKPGTRPELAEGWDCAKRKRSKESLTP